MLGNRDYDLGPPMVLWNPYFNRYQVCRPRLRKYLAERHPNYDFPNIYFARPLQIIFDTGFDTIKNIAENILSHPFMAIRRQCQVQCLPKTLHILPHTLIPVIYYLHKHQGRAVFLKGIGSAFVLQGMSFAIENFLSKRLSLPKEINIFRVYTFQFLRHLLLKWWTFIVMAPYYGAALATTVDRSTSSEYFGIKDTLVEGTYRLLHLGTSKKMIPMRTMAFSFAAYQLVKYLINLAIHQTSERYIFRVRSSTLRLNNITYEMMKQDRSLYCSIFSNMVTDILLYPRETVIHRCLCQGGGITIDNLDTGTPGLIPVTTSYKGLADCRKTCLNLQGNKNFYRGIGIIFFQYGFQILFMKFCQIICFRILLPVQRKYESEKPSPSSA